MQQFQVTTAQAVSGSSMQDLHRALATLSHRDKHIGTMLRAVKLGSAETVTEPGDSSPRDAGV